MSNSIKNCSVVVNAGVSEDHVTLVASLQEVMMKQLEVLQVAHGNLKPAPTTVTGIHMSGVNNADVSGTFMSGCDTGCEIDNSDKVSITGSMFTPYE